MDDQYEVPENPNKFVYNDENGGRKRKNRNFSKIKCLKNGKAAIQQLCKDLFNVKQERSEVEMKSIDHDSGFSQIVEQNLEESPEVNAVDASMRSVSQVSPISSRFSLVPSRCEALPSMASA